MNKFNIGDRISWEDPNNRTNSGIYIVNTHVGSVVNATKLGETTDADLPADGVTLVHRFDEYECSDYANDVLEQVYEFLKLKGVLTEDDCAPGMLFFSDHTTKTTYKLELTQAKYYEA